jgi:hypothetical protein
MHARLTKAFKGVWNAVNTRMLSRGSLQRFIFVVACANVKMRVTRALCFTREC